MHWRASAGGWAAGFAWTVSDRHPDVCACPAPTNASNIQHFASREAFKCLTTQGTVAYAANIWHFTPTQCVWAGVDSKRLLMNNHCTVYMLEAEWASGNEISAVYQYEKQAKQTFFLQLMNLIVLLR